MKKSAKKTAAEASPDIRQSLGLRAFNAHNGGPTGSKVQSPWTPASGSLELLTLSLLNEHLFSGPGQGVGTALRSATWGHLPWGASKSIKDEMK